MTPQAARDILGLKPDDDPRLQLADFKLARERIAECVRSTADPVLAARYEAGLAEYDEAMAVVFAPRAAEAVGGARRGGGWLGLFAAVVVLTVGGGGLWYGFDQRQRQVAAHERQVLMEELGRQGDQLVENRRWQDAAEIFEQLEKLEPGSAVAERGRRNIAAGQADEQTQFVGYWTGQAIAELEAGRLDEAEGSLKKVLESYPGQPEAVAIGARIVEARKDQARAAAVAAAREQLAARQWEAAIAACEAILATTPDSGEAQAVLADAKAALARQQADRARAQELFAKAAACDEGQFNAQGLAWLREAATLAPERADIASLLEKMASYTRTLRVPGDFAGPVEALAAARERDRIILAEATWSGPLVIDKAVDLEGAGVDKTIVECAATDGNALTIGPNAKGVRISGITFRHQEFHAVGGERFSAALVRGGEATFVECRLQDAGGHGLVVSEQGKVSVNRCRLADNGWNGAAAIGKGTLLEMRESEALNNFQHGIEAWDGAAVTLLRNRCENNCLNGIHVDGGSAAAIVEGNQLVANREYGLVADSAGAGKIADNTARGNLLGGLVIRAAAIAVPVTGNQATHNQGPGLVLERGLDRAAYSNNSIATNQGQQVVADAPLAPAEGATPAEPPRAVPVAPR